MARKNKDYETVNYNDIGGADLEMTTINSNDPDDGILGSGMAEKGRKAIKSRKEQIDEQIRKAGG